MKKIVSFLFAFAMSLPLWCGETGLFTYEGGFFIKDGNKNSEKWESNYSITEIYNLI